MEGKERSDCGRVRPRQSALKKKQEEYEKGRINVLDTSTVEKEEKGEKGGVELSIGQSWPKEGWKKERRRHSKRQELVGLARKTKRKHG
jgi:hypothetical protein